MTERLEAWDGKGYAPNPKIFPPQLLVERGFENKRLDAQTLETYVTKFGQTAEVAEGTTFERED